MLLSLRLRLADGLDVVRGRRDRLGPPRRANFVGDSDFRTTGDEFVALFRRYGGLASADRVLDVGCGIGRMARPLARELAPPDGSYDGFDIVADAIRWCARHYGGTAVPFRFVHADIRNAEYNPGGRLRAAEYRFPYPDGSFDLAIATSVFTHLLADDATHYLEEIARVLRPGGRLFSTWFLTDDAPRAGALIDFAHPLGVARVADPDAPAAAVSYPLRWLAPACATAGLALDQPITRGSWTGGTGPTPQDIAIARRPAR